MFHRQTEKTQIFPTPKVVGCKNPTFKKKKEEKEGKFYYLT